MLKQTTLYTIQFLLPPINRFTARKKVQTPVQERIQAPRKEHSKELPAPQPAPIHKLSMTSKVWNISIGQLG